MKKTPILVILALFSSLILGGQLTTIGNYYGDTVTYNLTSDAYVADDGTYRIDFDSATFYSSGMMSEPGTYTFTCSESRSEITPPGSNNDNLPDWADNQNIPTSRDGNCFLYAYPGDNILWASGFGDVGYFYAGYLMMNSGDDPFASFSFIDWYVDMVDDAGAYAYGCCEDGAAIYVEGNSDDCDDDADNDGICDDVDDCVGEYDDCEVCNGENADMDCAGVCFGNAYIEEECGDCVSNLGGDVMAWHEHHAAHGYGGDFFGIDEDVYNQNPSAFATWEPVTLVQTSTGLEFNFNVWYITDHSGGQGILYMYIQNYNYSGCDPSECPGSISEVIGGAITVDDSWYMPNGMSTGGIAEGECDCDGTLPEENFDCDGNCLSEIDCLGVCGGSAEVDCFGVCDGGAVIDDCGVCGGDSFDTSSDQLTTIGNYSGDTVTYNLTSDAYVADDGTYRIDFDSATFYSSGMMSEPGTYTFTCSESRSEITPPGSNNDNLPDWADNQNIPTSRDGNCFLYAYPGDGVLWASGFSDVGGFLYSGYLFSGGVPTDFESFYFIDWYVDIIDDASGNYGFGCCEDGNGYYAAGDGDELVCEDACGIVGGENICLDEDENDSVFVGDWGTILNVAGTYEECMAGIDYFSYYYENGYGGIFSLNADGSASHTYCSGEGNDPSSWIAIGDNSIDVTLYCGSDEYSFFGTIEDDVISGTFYSDWNDNYYYYGAETCWTGIRIDDSVQYSQSFDLRTGEQQEPGSTYTFTPETDTNQSRDCEFVEGPDAGCDGVCFSEAVVDDCGVCGGENADMDCAGECGGSSAEDDCGVCNGDGSSYDSFDVTDVVFLVQVIIDDDWNPDMLHCSDFNGDGGLDIVDIVQIVESILGDTRIVEATEVTLIKSDFSLALEADGFVGGIQMTISHNENFAIEFTGESMVSDYRTNGNQTTMIIAAPEYGDLFTASSNFVIEEVVAATAAGELEVHTPSEFGLSGAYPNPFNPSTSFDIYMSDSKFVSVNVYNVMGQLVDTIHSGELSSGRHTFVWNGSNISTGVYFIKASTSSDVAVKKVMLLK